MEGVATSMEAALTQIGNLVTTGMQIITGNEVLMVLFCAGLLTVGFRVIRSAKRSATA